MNHQRTIQIVFCLMICAFFNEAAASQSPNKGNASSSKKVDETTLPFRHLADRPRLENISLVEIRRQLSSRKIADRKKIVAQILSATSADVPKMAQFLNRSSRIPPDDYKNLLRSFGAAVPDQKGRFNQQETSEDLDWLEHLVKQNVDKLPAGLRPPVAESILSVALLRALAQTNHPEATIAILRFAYRHQGAFRDECGRQIRRMSYYAVPGLLRARQLQDPETYKIVRYAAYQLDRLNCMRPDHALRQVDPELRAEILHAYGEVRDQTAVNAVLAYINADSDKVRRAARWAFLRYVSGKPPEAIKRKLKLPGGKETEEEKSLYLTYHELAQTAIIEALTKEASDNKTYASENEMPLALRKQRRTWTRTDARTLAEKLFLLGDQKREAAQEKLFQDTMKLGEAGRLDEAIAQFDQILASFPYHSQRAQIANFYFRKGNILVDNGEYISGAQILTKALHLAPRAPWAAVARARRTLALALGDRGPSLLEGELELRHAAAMLPAEPRISLALKELKRRQQIRDWQNGGMGLGLLAAVSIIIFQLHRRRRGNK